MRLSTIVSSARSAAVLTFAGGTRCCNVLHSRPTGREMTILRLTRCFATSQQCQRQAPVDLTGNQTKAKLQGSYTTAFAMFEALWEAGVTNCFVNVGSDHPSILEAFVAGKRSRPNTFPRMITCPAEVTAISIADGYARVTGAPQGVLVHVDVGTQALGQGVHNASIARVPLFIFAGLCPSTESGELVGSKTEYSNWLQDAHDQAGIVRQYCRYVGEVRSGVNVKQMIGRALQFAKSAPMGPVYLSATREVLAQEIGRYELRQEEWGPVGPGALPGDAVETIARALVHAEKPLVLTGYSGRDRRTPGLLVELADMVKGLRVHDTGGSDMCFPASHPASEGFRLSTHECTKDADVIILIDCDIPWIPSKNPPQKDTKIYHIDIDPLNAQLRVSFFPAHGCWRADSFTALSQLVQHIRTDEGLVKALEHTKYAERANRQAERHSSHIAAIHDLADLSPTAPLTGHNIASVLRAKLPASTTFVVEAVTNSQIMHDHIQPSESGKWINCGATGIGWSNGAVVGVKLALQDQNKVNRKNGADEIVCQVVGDGSYMCAAPESAVWVGMKHQIPILTIILNNGGWKAPRNSVEMVYPDGLNKDATEDELNISFRPSPDYAAMAEAVAGKDWMKGVRVRTVQELERALIGARKRVGVEGKGMVVECMM